MSNHSNYEGKANGVREARSSIHVNTAHGKLGKVIRKMRVVEVEQQEGGGAGAWERLTAKMWSARSLGLASHGFYHFLFL
jgi:hypothetical protein